MGLAWTVRHDADTMRVALEGELDEDSRLSTFAREVSATAVVFDLAGVKRINSVGVRDWLTAMAELDGRGVALTLERCAPAIVAQLNMIRNFASSARVLSVLAPYVCDSCEREHTTLLDLADGRATPEPVVACPSCGASASFDDIPTEFLRFTERARPSRRAPDQ